MQSQGDFQKKIKRVWLGIFAVWILMLTGVLGYVNSEWGGRLEWIGLWVRAPGWIQWKSLQSLQEARKNKLEELEIKKARLIARVEGLKKDPEAQKEAIRRVLGYIAKDEILVMIDSKN